MDIEEGQPLSDLVSPPFNAAGHQTVRIILEQNGITIKEEATHYTLLFPPGTVYFHVATIHQGHYKIVLPSGLHLKWIVDMQGRNLISVPVSGDIPIPTQAGE